MSNSSLVDYVKITPNTNPRGYNKITKITIHHMAGNLSVETCGNVFQTREASTNYGVGTDGRVGMYAEEDKRTWASGSPDNDYQAVTMEVANDGGAPDWHVSDTALEKTILLCADICKRNGIERLSYTDNANGNLTRHNMFAATTCPGPYLQSKFPYIAEEVNKILMGEEKSIVDEPKNEYMLLYTSHVQNMGDLEGVRDGQMTGTTGKGLHMEALKIDTSKMAFAVTLDAKIHVSNEGWKEFKNVDKNTVLGTNGKNQSIEAIEFFMNGLPEDKTLKYQVHLSDSGWTGVIENGFTAGTVGIAKKIEAVRIWIE